MRWTSEDEPSVAIGQHLGLTAGEQAGAVGARQDADVDRDLAELRDAAAVHADALVEGELAGGLLVDEAEQPLADARLALGGFLDGLAVATGPGRPERVGDAGPQGGDATRQVVAEPDQQLGGRLGVGQCPVRLGELDAEEMRQRRELVVLEVGIALAGDRQRVEVAARLEVGAVRERGLDEPEVEADRVADDLRVADELEGLRARRRPGSGPS